jgi:hypothetical protein
MPAGQILVRSGCDWYHVSVFLPGIQYEKAGIWCAMNDRPSPSTIELTDAPALS